MLVKMTLLGDRKDEAIKRIMYRSYIAKKFMGVKNGIKFYNHNMTDCKLNTRASKRELGPYLRTILYVVNFLMRDIANRVVISF